MIDIRGLTAGYKGKLVLDDISLTVGRNERCALVGRNGAGKSTLLHTMLGLHPMKRGTVAFNGIPLDRNGWKRHVSYLPEKFQMYPHLTGHENMLFFAKAAGNGKADRARIEECMRKVNLWDARDKTANGLSKGMLQRLGLGLMLYFDSDILILDEPTSGLDPDGRSDFLAVLHTLTDKTILFSSHHMDEIRQVCTHVALLKDGGVSKFTVQQFFGHSAKGVMAL